MYKNYCKPDGVTPKGGYQCTATRGFDGNKQWLCTYFGEPADYSKFCKWCDFKHNSCLNTDAQKDVLERSVSNEN